MIRRKFLKDVHSAFFLNKFTHFVAVAFKKYDLLLINFVVFVVFVLYVKLHLTNFSHFAENFASKKSKQTC